MYREASFYSRDCYTSKATEKRTPKFKKGVRTLNRWIFLHQSKKVSSPITIEMDVTSTNRDFYNKTRKINDVSLRNNLLKVCQWIVCTSMHWFLNFMCTCNTKISRNDSNSVCADKAKLTPRNVCVSDKIIRYGLNQRLLGYAMHSIAKEYRGNNLNVYLFYRMTFDGPTMENSVF